MRCFGDKLVQNYFFDVEVLQNKNIHIQKVYSQKLITLEKKVTFKVMNQPFLLGALHPWSLFRGGVPRWATSVWPVASGPGVGQHCRNRRSQRIRAAWDESGWFQVSWKKDIQKISWTSIDLSDNLVLWKWPPICIKTVFVASNSSGFWLSDFSCHDWSYDEMASCLCAASGTIWSGTKQVRRLRDGVWIHLWPLRGLKGG